MKTMEGGGRAELAAALAGKGAHVDFEGAIRNFPPELRGVKSEKVPHTGWQLLSTFALRRPTFWISRESEVPRIEVARRVLAGKRGPSG